MLTEFYFQMLFLIFTTILFKNILSSPIEKLNKYSSITTKQSSLLINITDFKYEENIYLTLKSEEKCEEYLGYKFFDDIEDINEKETSFKHSIKPDIVLKRYLFGPKAYSYIYTVVKRKDLLLNVKGNLLYIEYYCGGEVEIINTKRGQENIYITAILFCSILMFGVFVFIILKEMVYSFIIVMNKSFKTDKNWKIKSNINSINRNLYINQAQLKRNFSPERIVYVGVRQNMYNRNQDYNNNYNNNIVYPDYNNYNKNINSLENCNDICIPVNEADYPQAPASDSQSSNSPNQTFIRQNN